MPFERVLDDAVVAFTFCFISWVIFGSLRRYLMARSNVAIQEKVVARIDSMQSLLALAANESGRHFLESLTLERTEPVSPARRILFGIQAGIVLTCFGIAMLVLHHVLRNDVVRNGPGLLIFGTGAVGLGMGFFIAAAVSLTLSRSLGLTDHDRRG